MLRAGINVVGWSKSQAPNRITIGAHLDSEGLDYYQWSSGPGDVYSAHYHSYDKIIYVVEGTITFGIPEENRTIELSVGDRFELPAGVVHSAIVGSRGVVCFESHFSKD